MRFFKMGSLITVGAILLLATTSQAQTGYGPGSGYPSAWSGYTPGYTWGSYSTPTGVVMAPTPPAVVSTQPPAAGWAGYAPRTAWTGYNPGAAWTGYTPAPSRFTYSTSPATRGAGSTPNTPSNRPMREFGTGRPVGSSKPWLR
ncbi:hypothetical protein BH23PLA1_BH23PLA1_37250 [soil metagenome]